MGMPWRRDLILIDGAAQATGRGVGATEQIEGGAIAQPVRKRGAPSPLEVLEASSL